MQAIVQQRNYEKHEVFVPVPVLIIMIKAKVKSGSFVLLALLRFTSFIIANTNAANKDKHATTENPISFLSMSFTTRL